MIRSVKRLEAQLWKEKGEIKTKYGFLISCDYEDIKRIQNWAFDNNIELILKGSYYSKPIKFKISLTKDEFDLLMEFKLEAEE